MYADRFGSCRALKAVLLVAVDGPVGIWDFFAAVEFEVGAGADLFDQLSEPVGLSTMDRAAFEVPASQGSVFEWEGAANTQHQEFMGNSPVVAHAHLGFDPEQA